MTPYYTPHIPTTVGELMDKLGSMMLNSPTFIDDTGYFPGKSIDTEFFALNEGLKRIRSKIGDERYLKLVELSDRMRGHFEADPEDKKEDALIGRRIIHQMEEILVGKRD